jgi:hypothetical protein
MWPPPSLLQTAIIDWYSCRETLLAPESRWLTDKSKPQWSKKCQVRVIINVSASLTGKFQWHVFIALQLISSPSFTSYRSSNIWVTHLARNFKSSFAGLARLCFWDLGGVSSSLCLRNAFFFFYVAETKLYQFMEDPLFPLVGSLCWSRSYKTVEVKDSKVSLPVIGPRTEASRSYPSSQDISVHGIIFPSIKISSIYVSLSVPTVPTPNICFDTYVFSPGRFLWV